MFLAATKQARGNDKTDVSKRQSRRHAEKQRANNSLKINEHFWEVNQKNSSGLVPVFFERQADIW